MTMNVTGIGWISGSAYGLVKSQVHNPLPPPEKSLPPRSEVFASPFRNFGRLDHASQMVCCAVGLALRDSGLRTGTSPERLVGIVGGGRFGCADSDLLYFRDYVESGRTLGRGNYFVYTLPTSPLAEASIHFGLRGAVVYVQGSRDDMDQVLETAALMIEEDEGTAMVAGIWEQNAACFSVLEMAGPESQGRTLCSLDEALNATRGILGTRAPSLGQKPETAVP